MTELEALQNKMNEAQMQEELELYIFLDGCNECALDGKKKAVKGLLQMAVAFYGKERVLASVESYDFKALRKFIGKLEGV